MARYHSSHLTRSSWYRGEIARLALKLCLLLITLGALSLAYTLGQPLPLSHSLARTLAQQPARQLQVEASALPLTPLFHGNLQRPEVALTFDDGPNPAITPQILAVLQRFQIRATFFCIGQLVVKYPGIVLQEEQAGNLVEDHTWSHPGLDQLSAPDIAQQMEKGKQAIEQVTGVAPTFFRSPYGELNSTIMKEARQLDLSMIMWNVDSLDWTQPGANVLVTRVVQGTRNGAIILLHDGGGNSRAQTLAALPRIITALQQRGFRFVTIQQMVDDLA